MSGLQEIAIEDIWLMREGDDAVVYVKRQGLWYEVIRELAEGSFSHCITANGIASRSCTPAHWLNEKQGLVDAAQPRKPLEGIVKVNRRTSSW